MKRIIHLLVIAVTLLTLAAFASSPRTLAGDAERVLIQFEPGGKGAIKNTLQRAGGNIHHEFDDLNTIAVTVPTAALNGLRHNPNVVSIEPDAPRYMMAQTVPWGIDRVQARDIWDANRDDVIDDGAPTGAGVQVCIIDSGLYTAHEDMAGVDVIGGYPSGWDTDLCGHGTHVAGTIAAANNNLGVVGVSPGEVSLYIFKVFGDDCSWTYSSDLVNAANHCADEGADIISMSLGGNFKNRTEQTTFQDLYDQGILSVAAAGNDGNTRKSYPASYPSVVSVAAIDENNVIADFSQQNSEVELAAPGVDVLSTVPWFATDELTVGGVTYNGNHIEYAPYGNASGALVHGGLCDSVGSWNGDVVLCERGDISFYDKVMNVQNGGGVVAAIYNNEPGNFLGTLGEGFTSDILAISLSQEDGQYLVANKLGLTGDLVSSISIPDSGYEAWEGTSMATPHVAGVAALLWSSDPGLTNIDIRDAMNQTALDLGASGRDVAYGYGLVQAYDAWQSFGGGNVPPVASFTYTCTDLSCDFDASGSSDSDGTIVSYDWDFGDGTSGSGVMTNHTFASAGTYTVILTVTDDGSATDTDTQNVTVGGGSTSTMFVYAIDMSGKAAGPNRSATASVTIHDTSGNPVAGATVAGAWSGDYTGSVSGITGTDGKVSFVSGKVRQADAVFTFTVNDVAKSGYVYDAGLNNETSDTIVVP